MTGEFLSILQKDWVPDLECNKDHPADPFKPYGATPGHGIEWARLITQWALSVYGTEDPKGQPYLEAAQKLYRRAVADGWNVDGAPGIVYTTDWKCHPGWFHDRDALSAGRSHQYFGSAVPGDERCRLCRRLCSVFKVSG